MIRRVLTAVAVAVVCASPAFAQGQQAGVNAGSPATVADSGAAKADPAPATGKIAFVRVFGGWEHSKGTNGFSIGGGVAALPFGNDNMELQGDFRWVRANAANAQIFSGNLIYDATTEQNFTPFVGAGLAIAHGGGSTDPGLQLLGGVSKPINAKAAFRGEIRLGIFDGYNVFSLLGGFSF